MARIIINPFQKSYLVKKISRADLLASWPKRHVIDHKYAYRDEKDYSLLKSDFKDHKVYNGLKITSNINLQDNEWSLYIEVDNDNFWEDKIETCIQVSGKYGFSDSVKLTVLRQSGVINLTGNPGYITSNKPIARIQFGCIEGEIQGNSEDYNFVLTHPFCFHQNGEESAVAKWAANGNKPFSKDVYISNSAHPGQYNVYFNVKLNDTNFDFKEFSGEEITVEVPPRTEWELSFLPMEQPVQISVDNMRLGALNIKKISNNEYERPLSVTISTSNEIYLYDIESAKYLNSFESNVNVSVSIPVYLMGGFIKNLSRDYQSPEYIISVYDGEVRKEERFILASNIIANETGSKVVVLTAKDSFGYGYAEQLNIYRGMEYCPFQLNISSLCALQNVSIELQEGSLGKIRSCLMPINGSINRDKNLLTVASIPEQQNITCDLEFNWPPNSQVYIEKILLRSDYCWDSFKEIQIQPMEKEDGNLEIELNPIYDKQNVFIGGTKSVIGTFSIKNTNMSQTNNRDVAKEICIHGLGIYQLGANGNYETLPCMSIIDKDGKVIDFRKEKDLAPMEMREFEILFQSDYSPLVEGSIQYQIICDNWNSLSCCLNIYNRTQTGRGLHKWIKPDEDLSYKLNVSCVQVGSIELSASPKQDPNIYINREDEVVTLINKENENKEWVGCLLAPKFFFIDGKYEKEQIIISALDKPKVFPVICRFDSWLNEDYYEGWVPMKYSCKGFEDEIEGQSFQINAKKETPVLGIFNECNEEISSSEDGEDETNEFSLDYKYDKTLFEYESSEVTCLHIRNKSITPYHENGIRYGIELCSIKAIDLTNVISLSQMQMPVTIQNGAEDFDVPINLDWSKYVEVGKPDLLKFAIEIIYKINSEEERIKNVTCTIKMLRESIDNWYSLDLGTTGIVVAKWLDNKLEIIDIDPETGDNRTRIEKEDNIMSSIVATFDSDNGATDIRLNPDYSAYMRDTQDVFVPIKFIIGQKHIPFLNFSDNRQYFLFENKTPVPKKELLPDKIVTAFYYFIFSHLNQTLANNERLILTYPNTYVPEQINKIRGLLTMCYPENDIQFVSESDAVVSYYVNKKSQNEGFPRLHEHGKERILIYDMGAGTLDISYVVLTLSGENETKKYNVDIQKRVGLPVGGNLLDSILFDAIKNVADDFAEIEENEFKKQQNLRKYKTWISNYVKTQKNHDKQLKDILFGDNEVITNCTQKLKEVYENDVIKEYLVLCTETIFSSLLGDNWKTEIDTFVLSGRAAQFLPLYDKIKDIFGDKLDEDTISTNEYKVCVASGALHYCRIFEDEPNYHFSITNKNQYLNIGLLYNIDNGVGGTKKHYVQLFDLSEPSKQEGVTWSTPENGTQYMLYESEKKINLQKANKITFIQTILNEKEVIKLMETSNRNGTNELHKRFGKECFMNELFEIYIPTSHGQERSKCILYVKIDKNNNILVKLNKNKRPLEYGNENVELNEFYRKSFWPFVDNNV